MKTAFDKAFDFVLTYEGGYSNDPDDPGGVTKYGISKRYHPNVDVENLTIDEAKDIYRREYWTLSGCEQLTPQVAVVVFDTAVNCGVSRATHWFTEDPTIDGILMRRVQHYLDRCTSNPSQRKFLRGWLRRVTGLWNVALNVNNGMNG